MKALFTILALVSCVAVAAQNASTASLSWHVQGSKNPDSTSFRDYRSEFRTTSTEVVWLQNNGHRSSTYPITSIEGSWQDVGRNGSIILHVSRQGRPGTLTLRRTPAGITILMEITPVNATAFRQQFKVMNVTQTP